MGLAVAVCTLPWLGFVPDEVASTPRAAVVRLAERLQVDPVVLAIDDIAHPVTLVFHDPVPVNQTGDGFRCCLVGGQGCPVHEWTVRHHRAHNRSNADWLSSSTAR